MNIRTKKLIGTLPLLLSLTLALTSCSTTGNLQSAPGGTNAHHMASQQSHSYQVHHMAKAQSASKTRHIAVAQSIAKSRHVEKTQSVTKVKPAAKPVQKPVLITTQSLPSKKILVKVSSTKAETHPVQWQQNIQKHNDSQKSKQQPITMSHNQTQNGEQWLMNLQGVTAKPGTYKRIGKQKAAIKNINHLDAINGNYHFIQVVRWDGSHINQSYIHATQAEMMALVGLGLVESGYFETSDGTTIIVLSGNGKMTTIPGHRFELILNRAKVGPVSQQESPKKSRSHKKRHRVSMMPSPVEAFVLPLSIIKQYAAIDNAGSEAFQLGTDMPVAGDKTITLLRDAEQSGSSSTVNRCTQHICSIQPSNHTLNTDEASLITRKFCKNDHPISEAMTITDFGSYTVSASNSNIDAI